MSDEELKAEIERLRSENAALKKGATPGIRMKVSEKGGVSVYGMGRFPVTLYKEQWLKLLDMSDDIRAFIAANERAEGKASKINCQTSYRILSTKSNRPARPSPVSDARISNSRWKRPSRRFAGSLGK